jgi:hypothetical protein
MQTSSVFFCLILAGSCGLCLGFSPNPSRIPLLAGGRAVGAKSSPRSQGIVDLSMVSQDRRSVLLQLPLLVAGVALANPQAARAEVLPVTVIGPSGGNLGSEVVASMVSVLDPGSCVSAGAVEMLARGCSAWRCMLRWWHVALVDRDFIRTRCGLSLPHEGGDVL